MNRITAIIATALLACSCAMSDMDSNRSLYQLGALGKDMAIFLAESAVYPLNKSDEAFLESHPSFTDTSARGIVRFEKISAEDGGSWKAESVSNHSNMSFETVVTRVPSLIPDYFDWIIDGECHYDEGNGYKAALQTRDCLMKWDETLTEKSVHLDMNLSGTFVVVTTKDNSLELDRFQISLNEQDGDNQWYSPDVIFLE